MRVRLTILTWLLTASLLAADETSRPEVPSYVWGLQIGDGFSIQTVVDQTTTITPDGGKPHVVTRRETLVFHYQVALTRANRAYISVSMDRPHVETKNGLQPSAEQLRRLSQVKWKLQVAPDGTVFQQGEFTHPPVAINRASARSQKLLVDSGAAEALMNLSELPFWLSPNIVGDQQLWKRDLTTPLGPYGSMRSIVKLRPETTDPPEEENEPAEAENESTETDETIPAETVITNVPILISADSRFVPSAISQEGTLIRYSDPKFEMKDFSGSAEMIRPSAEPQKRRPWFQAMELSWTISGTVDVSSGGKPKRLQIEQKNTHRSKRLAKPN